MFLHCYSKMHTIVKEYLSSSRPPGLLTTCSQVPWPEPLWKFSQTLPNKGAKEALQHTQADICPFFTRCMFILPILLWFLRTKRWWSFRFKALLCIPSQWSLWESCQYNNVRFLLLSREVLSSFLSYSHAFNASIPHPRYRAVEDRQRWIHAAVCFVSSCSQ